MRLRKTNPGDLPQLKALWALGFGDTEQEIEAFFAISYPATGFCAEEDGKVIAAAYALPQELAWGEKSCRSAYLYAVTTHPDFRRRGICAKLLAYAEKELKKRYFDCLTLVPATDALRAYYETLGFVSQNAAFFDEGDAPEARGVCEVLTPAEYAGLRETVLYDLPHVRYGLSDLRYQASMSGFYRLELGSHFGCACAHPDASELSQLLQLQKVALYGLHGYVQRAGGRFAVTEPVAPHKSQQGFLPLSDNHFHHLMMQYGTKSNKNQQKE